MINVQYGCGLSAPNGWINFDSSPTLRLQRVPVVGGLLTRGRVKFPRNVRYGDVTSGLPIPDNYCHNVYASHVLEHLSLEDAYKALSETLRILKPGGLFRVVVPDLEILARRYIEQKEASSGDASIQFMRNSLLGLEKRPRGILGWLTSSLGNADHLWMWDGLSLVEALRDTGFSDVRPAHFNDSESDAFTLVEQQDRFLEAVAVEARK